MIVTTCQKLPSGFFQFLEPEEYSASYVQAQGPGEEGHTQDRHEGLVVGHSVADEECVHEEAQKLQEIFKDGDDEQ